MMPLTVSDNRHQTIGISSPGRLRDRTDTIAYDTISSETRRQAWTLDALGNSSSVVTDAATQTRTHNARNQILTLTGLTNPAYDNNGQMITDEAGQTYIYD